MLLFGMLNWMFTWMKPGEHMSYLQMSEVVAAVFLNGFPSMPLDVAAIRD